MELHDEHYFHLHVGQNVEYDTKRLSGVMVLEHVSAVLVSGVGGGGRDRYDVCSHVMC